jgi:hypothetical protein
MPTVKVTALKAFTYRGADISRGQLVLMEPADAASSARQGEISLSRGASRRAEERAKAEAAKPRRRYRRRDMQAEE